MQGICVLCASNNAGACAPVGRFGCGLWGAWLSLLVPKMLVCGQVGARARSPISRGTSGNSSTMVQSTSQAGTTALEAQAARCHGRDEGLNLGTVYAYRNSSPFTELPLALTGVLIALWVNKWFGGNFLAKR